MYIFKRLCILVIKTIRNNSGAIFNSTKKILTVLVNPSPYCQSSYEWKVNYYS